MVHTYAVYVYLHTAVVAVTFLQFFLYLFGLQGYTDYMMQENNL